MTTTPHPTHHEPSVQPIQPSTRRLVRSGALAGAIAAVCTTGVAAFARAADVSLDVNAATKAVLVGSHLLAAAIIIPTLSQRLTAVNNDR